MQEPAQAQAASLHGGRGRGCRGPDAARYWGARGAAAGPAQWRSSYFVYSQSDKALELAQGAWAKSLDATWACAWNLAV